jgi:crotonobetainyl-CoA:carnitine CoA-transferase CaiB-like acyl-CoA transferase
MNSFLNGVRVLDFSRALAGPFCTMMLSDLGAEIIKVEPPPKGDEARLWGPPFVNGESAYFLSINRGKKSIVIDLNKEKGKEVIRRLIEKSDVIVENFRPGTTTKLGIDYETASKLNSKIIYCSISGFGQTGPYKSLPGYDIIAFALSGMMSITGEEGRPPVKVGVPVADIGAGMYAAYAIVAALYRREKLGIGEYIDVSLLEGQISWLTYQAESYFITGVEPKRLGSAHMTIAPYQAFKAKDDYFIVAAGNDEHWRKLCDAISADELKNDSRFISNPDRVRNREQLEKLLNEIFSKDKADNWIAKISASGVPCCRINTLSSVFSDKHVKERGIVKEVQHKKAGKVKLVGMPYRFKNYELQQIEPPPLLGEDTEQLLTWLGYKAEEIVSLRNEGVLGQS